MGCQNMSKNACYRFRRQQPHRRSRLLTLFFCVLELHVQNGICLLFIFQQNKATIPRTHHCRLSKCKVFMALRLKYRHFQSKVKATEVTLQDLVPSSFWYGKNIGSFTAVIDREWYEMKWHINWSKRKCVSHCLIGCVCSGATAFLNPHPTLHPPALQVEAKGTVALQSVNTLKS